MFYTLPYSILLFSVYLKNYLIDNNIITTRVTDLLLVEFAIFAFAASFSFGKIDSYKIKCHTNITTVEYKNENKIVLGKAGDFLFLKDYNSENYLTLNIDKIDNLEFQFKKNNNYISTNNSLIKSVKNPR